MTPKRATRPAVVRPVVGAARTTAAIGAAATLKGTIMSVTTVAPATTLHSFGSLATRAPYALLVTRTEEGVLLVGDADSTDAFLLYGTVNKTTGLFVTRLGSMEIRADRDVEVLTPSVLMADAANVRTYVKHVVTCAHIHDTAFSGMPDGITWTFGIVRATGRDCPVCKQGTLEGCLGAPKAETIVNRYGKDDIREDLMGLSCADKDRIVKGERAAAKADKVNAEKAAAAARVLAAAAAAAPEVPEVAPVKRARRKAAPAA